MLFSLDSSRVFFLVIILLQHPFLRGADVCRPSVNQMAVIQEAKAAGPLFLAVCSATLPCGRKDGAVPGLPSDIRSVGTRSCLVVSWVRQSPEIK